MATLQPGEKARMYALGKIARGGATRGGYVSGRVFIAIDGVHVGYGGTPGAAHVGVIIDSLTIRDELDETPNTCTFRVNGTVPAIGAEVIVTLGSKNSGTRLFAGFALGVQQIYAADKPANLQADVHAVDYTWQFGFAQVTKRFRNVSATWIAYDLAINYAPGFGGNNIAPNLPIIDEITFTNEDLTAALTRLARRIGGYWYIDYQRDVHLFLDEPSGAPEVLTPQHASLADFQKSADRTQVLTRVYVEGRGSTLLGPVLAGDSRIPLRSVDMFAIAPDVFAKVSPQGSEGGAQHLTYTGINPGGGGSLVGPGMGPPGAPSAVKASGGTLPIGRYSYAYTDKTAAGETLASPVAVIDVGGAIPPPIDPPTAAPQSATVGVDLGSHVYAYTYITAGGGETTPSPASEAIVTTAPITPTGGVSRIEVFLTGVLAVNTYYHYRVTYAGDVSGETTAAPWTNWFNNPWNNRPHVFVSNSNVADLPKGVRAVHVYRSLGAQSWNTYQYGPFYYAGSVTVPAAPDMYLPYFDDMTPEASLGAPMPSTNTAVGALRRVAVTMPAATTADPSITGVKLYRTAANTNAPYKLVAQVAGGPGAALTYDDTTPDASLGAAPPTVNTAGNEYRAVAVSAIAVGPTGTVARNLYRTDANGSQLKWWGALNDNVTTAATDTGAPGGVNAPLNDTSGFQLAAGQVPSGSVALPVANAAPFAINGGFAVIGNGEQVIRYTGRLVGQLTGIPATGVGSIAAGITYGSTATAAPMLTGIPATGPRAIQTALTGGDEVYLVVQVDDAARQATVAAMVKIGSGVREEWIQDRRLAITEARARGVATLALRPLEDVTITYRCRDLRTASGKTIAVNLPAPTNVSGSFKIQSVTIDRFRPYPTQYPTFTVTASSRRFSFEDWLRRLETSP